MNEYNDKGLKEGYWERYYSNGNLNYRGNYINDTKNGYWEVHYYVNGNLCRSGNYINDNKNGYWEMYEIDGNLIEKEFHL